MKFDFAKGGKTNTEDDDAEIEDFGNGWGLEAEGGQSNEYGNGCCALVDCKLSAICLPIENMSRFVTAYLEHLNKSHVEVEVHLIAAY